MLTCNTACAVGSGSSSTKLPCYGATVAQTGQTSREHLLRFCASGTVNLSVSFGRYAKEKTERVRKEKKRDHIYYLAQKKQESLNDLMYLMATILSNMCFEREG